MDTAVSEFSIYAVCLEVGSSESFKSALQICGAFFAKTDINFRTHCAIVILFDVSILEQNIDQD
jgi:hypothetical protein